MRPLRAAFNGEGGRLCWEARRLFCLLGRLFIIIIIRLIIYVGADLKNKTSR